MKKYISISYISEFLNNLSENIKTSKNTSKTKNITASCKVKIDRNNGSLYPDIKWKIGNDPVEYAPRFGYRGSPTEVIARLQPLREELYRKGIHYSATEDISKETLMNYIDQTFQNENEPVSGHLKDLWNEVKGNREQGVENLQWMLNNIAQRDEKNNKPVVAQKGGSIGNSLKDQLNALAQKFQK